MTCWGCTKHAETGLPGFVQVGCVDCERREFDASKPAFEARQREINQAANRIAKKYAGTWRQQKEELAAEMRREWPNAAEYRRGRPAVLDWIKQIEERATA